MPHHNFRREDVALNERGDPEWDEVSPDGRTLVHWVITQGRMSHEIETPRIMDAATREPLLELGDEGYDATIWWQDDGRFTIGMRHYWRPERLVLKVDRTSGTFRTVDAEDAEGPDRPIAEMTEVVSRHFTALDGEREAARKEAERAFQEQLEASRRWSRWDTAGVLFLGFCGAFLLYRWLFT
jgi:hypothetical protein